MFDDGLLTGKELVCGFHAPDPEGMDHRLYGLHVERTFPQGVPCTLGIPANAEVTFLVKKADDTLTAFSR